MSRSTPVSKAHVLAKTDSLATTSKNKGWNIEALDKLDAVGVAMHVKIEASECTTREGIGATLEYNCAWPISLHDLTNDLLED